MSLIDKNTNEYKELLRTKRKPLLNAFDIHKTNVNYGICTETEEEKQVILEWYYKILELDEEAINNVPEHIKRFL